MSRKSSGKEVATIVALICVTWATLAGSMFFWFGSGEHDTFMMAAGVVHGVRIDQVINSWNYGSDLQFMWYYALHYVTRAFAMDGHAVLFVMNFTGTLLALLIPFLLFLLLRTDDPTSSVSPNLATLLLITSPSYAFIVPYGHPFHLAFVLSLLSMLIFRRFARGPRVSRRFLLLLTAVLLQGLALAIRAEQVFLFWFCVIGLFIYEREENKETWLWLFACFAFSALTFAALHYFMVTAVSATFDAASSAMATPKLWDFILGLYRTVRSIYIAIDIPRSIAFHITDIGFPLITMLGFFLVKQLRERQYRPVLALIVSVGPSFFVYLANISPPRHFVITVIGLAIYVGASARKMESYKLISLGVIVLATNLLIPLVLSVVDPGGVEGRRRTYTYNVFQRLDRSRELTKTAMHMFPTLLSSAPTQTVIFGEWPHIAQLALLMSSEQGANKARAEIAPSISALVFSYGGRTIYLVEAYDDADVRRMVTMAGKLHPQLHFLSLFPGSTVNDLGIIVPKEMGWWGV